MGEVLGRVTANFRTPRGPDAKHSVTVKWQWLEEGLAIECELPRNLTCAACDGGGCDACQRSGAVSLRARGEPVERLQVTLPSRPAESGQRGVVLRIPEHGGVASGDVSLPRGFLLLTVSGAEHADAGVRAIRSTLPPPEVVGPASGWPLPLRHTKILLVLVLGLLLALVLLFFWRR